MSYKRLSPEDKQEILRKHFEEGRTTKSLCDEYFIAHSTIEKWITDYRKECQKKPELKVQSDMYAYRYRVLLKLNFLSVKIRLVQNKCKVNNITLLRG